MFVNLKDDFLSRDKLKFVVKVIEYKSKKIRSFKDDTPNSRICDVVSLSGQQNL